MLRRSPRGRDWTARSRRKIHMHRHVELAAFVVALGCRADPPSTLEPSVVEQPDGAESSEPAEPTCASRLGIDADALGRACGFERLLGVQEVGVCELHYSRGEGNDDAVVSAREHRSRDVESAWG